MSTLASKLIKALEINFLVQMLKRIYITLNVLYFANKVDRLELFYDIYPFT